MKQKADETGISSTVSNAATNIKATSDSTGFTNVLVSAQKTTSKYAHKAADVTYSAGTSVVESAKDGTLKDKTTASAASAGAFVGGLGSSLYKGAASWGLVSKPEDPQNTNQ